MRYWSIAHGCRVVRVSLSDASGREYFATVTKASLNGKDYRAKLDDVLNCVQDAIEDSEVPPGEVRYAQR